MYDPNKILTEILRERDDEFRQLEAEIQTLQDRLGKAPEAEKPRLIRRMVSLRERVDARISHARSA